MMNNITPDGCLLLSFTTLTHMYAVPFAPTIFYEAMIRMSTFLNFVWHLSNTPATSVLGVLDHACAYSWFLLDTWMSWNTLYFQRILFANALIASISWSLPWLEKKVGIPYSISHSIWHLLSAAKAIYVAASLNSLQGMHEVIV
jgi:hypothetical protein